MLGKIKDLAKKAKQVKQTKYYSLLPLYFSGDEQQIIIEALGISNWYYTCEITRFIEKAAVKEAKAILLKKKNKIEKRKEYRMLAKQMEATK